MNIAKRAGTVLITAYFLWYAWTYAEWHFIDGANLIFHEAGHAIFVFFGAFVEVAMGSGLQVLLPLGIAAYFFLKHQNTSGSVCLMWAGQNLLNVSLYAGDATKMQMDLLGGDSAIHDWNYLLSATHLITATDLVSNIIYGLGIATLLAGAALALYFPFFDSTLHEETAWG